MKENECTWCRADSEKKHLHDVNLVPNCEQIPISIRIKFPAFLPTLYDMRDDKIVRSKTIEVFCFWCHIYFHLKLMCCTTATPLRLPLPLLHYLSNRRVALLIYLCCLCIFVSYVVCGLTFIYFIWQHTEYWENLLPVLPFYARCNAHFGLMLVCSLFILFMQVNNRNVYVGVRLPECSI